MRKITKRAAAIIAASVLAVGTGGAAFAYAAGWFNGSGTVVAASSTIQPISVTVDLGNTDATRLYPGKSVQVKAATVNNANDYPVQINSIAVGSVSTNKTGCGQSQAGLTFTDMPDDVIPARGSKNNVVLGSIKLSDSADPVCAGAVFTVTATMNGEIAAH